MDPDKAKVLATMLAALRVFVRNVAKSGRLLPGNETRDQYREMYKKIKAVLSDDNLEIFAPNISSGRTSGGDGNLWPEHQIEIVNCGTQLITYIEAVLSSEPIEARAVLNQHREPANIFISHGHKSIALDLIREYISALGLIPVIVLEQPSQGMSVDTKVTGYMKSCEAAIILATGDDKIEGKTYFQPRQNVIHEIGLAQQILINRVIYLLEEGAEFPSNIAPKVYEIFTKDNLSRAFIAIARDLRAFGIL